MLKITIFVVLLTGAALSDGFLFPDQVSSKTKSESWYGEGNDRSNLNSYGHRYTDQGNHQTFGRDKRYRPGFNEHYNGNQGEFTSGFGNSHHRGNQPNYGGIVSQSGANAQSSGFGSQANSQSGSEFFNGGFQSNSQSQAQSQGYQAYPFGPSGGGSGASSASSAASATSGIVDGVATASAAAAAASASSGNGGSSSSSSSASSMAGNNGGFVNGQNSPWFFRTRVAGEDDTVNTANANAGAAAATSGDDKLIFSAK